MAKLEKLPEQWIIDGFKGTIDFYYWKGIAVARKWPVFQPYPFSEAQKSNQAAFAYINKLYSQLSLSVIVGFTLLAARTSQTPKDYIVRAYMKGMFAIMPPEYYATEETLLLLLAQLDVALSTRALEAGGNLAAILAQLDVALSTRALEAGGNLASILTRLNAINITQGNLVRAQRVGILASGAGWTNLLTIAGKGTFLGLDLVTDYASTTLGILVDAASLELTTPTGSALAALTPDNLHNLNGHTSFWLEDLWDAGTPAYSFHLKAPIQYNSGLIISYFQNSGLNKNVTILAFYRPIT